jgi:HK97 family phage major capsid protein
MSKILELREKRAKAWDAAKAFLDAKRDDKGFVSPEDTATYDKMEADVVALGKEVERLERQSAIDAEMAKATSTPITNQPAATSAQPKGGVRASAEYKQDFWNTLRGKKPTPILNSLQVGTEENGGFLVPTEFETTLVQALEDENVIRKIARIITTGNDREIPIVASKGTATWVAENAPIPESDNTFDRITLGAFKLATTIKVSNELLSDSVFNLEGYIAEDFARRIGQKEEEAFCVGDGVGKPTGIFHATLGGQVGITTASATAITLDEVLDLIFSLKAPYRRNAVFLMNEATLKALRKLKDSTGQYLWQPSNQEGTPDKLLNHPIVTSPSVPSIGAGNKAIAFGDFKQYWVADREERTFKRLNELYAISDQVGFVATQRVDAKVILPEAIKLLAMKP